MMEVPQPGDIYFLCRYADRSKKFWEENWPRKRQGGQKIGVNALDHPVVILRRRSVGEALNLEVVPVRRKSFSTFYETLKQLFY